jgi:N-acetylmuramoyl-L-alanine amidase
LNRYTVTSDLRSNDRTVQGFNLPKPFIGRAGLFLFAAIFSASLQAKDNISVLGSKPRWEVLEDYQQTITHDEFAHLINDVYCTHGLAPDLIEIKDDTARILISREAQKFFTLRFAAGTRDRKPVPRLWRPAKSLPGMGRDKPLSGLKIALDPGHLGGKWAKMEERWFQVGDSKPVQEGDLTLRVAGILASRLRELGAKVSFVRNSDEPTTVKRPMIFASLPGRF